VGGMVLAMVALVALHRRARGAVPLVWLLVAETAIDTVANVTGGIRERLFGAANGVTWLVVSFYVPLLMVSLGLIVWQLYSRRGDPLPHPIASPPPFSKGAWDQPAAERVRNIGFCGDRRQQCRRRTPANPDR